MNQVSRSIIELNIAVLLFGLTAILGALISINATELVWWRLLFTCGSILLIFPVVKTWQNMDKKSIRIFSTIGLIVALHWITFYGSIKAANASTALICLATTAFFTSIIEPLVFNRKIALLELLLGVMIVPGMSLVVESSPSSYSLGIVMGLTSALFATIFSVFNKRYIDLAPPLMITFIELGSGFLFITALLVFYNLINASYSFIMPSGYDFLLLLILALFCTTLAYVLALRALKHLTAFASNLMINLEPVYGIILAYFLLDDSTELQPGFYLGSSIIILSLVIYFISKRHLKRAYERRHIKN